MQEHEPPSPHELLALKDELRARWQKLPPEHQASMVLTLINDVMQGKWGNWLQGAIAISYPTTEREEQHATNNNANERYTAFGFTYTENLFNTISDERFLDLLRAADTVVHSAEVSSNAHGEFLFVTASRANGDRREVVGFWGQGFHDRRDRYLLDEWRWYVSTHRLGADEAVEKEELLKLIAERRQELEIDAKGYRQSARGEFYEQLADLTDEDGAATEMDDLGDMFDDGFGQ